MSPPTIVIATNEPWGGYHLQPLAKVIGEAAHIYHLCPDLERPSNPGPGIRVSADRGLLQSADLVVVTGLHSRYTQEVAAEAASAGARLAFCELAYLTPQDAPADPIEWVSVSAACPASRYAVAQSAGVQEDDVTIFGWPTLDNLPVRATARGVLALTSVSAPTPSGGHNADDNARLYEVLRRLENDYPITVRPHPREDPQRWDRWDLDFNLTPAAAIAEAQAVIGVPGTATMFSAAIGTPFVAVGTRDSIPEAIIGLTTPWRDDLCLEELHPTSPDRVAAACGPIGGAAERLLQAWLAVLEPRELTLTPG